MGVHATSDGEGEIPRYFYASSGLRAATGVCVSMGACRGGGSLLGGWAMLGRRLYESLYICGVLL